LLVVQSEAFNWSRISTVLCATITNILALRIAPGNVLLPANDGGLPKDSVVNVSQVVTVDRTFLKSHARSVSPTVMAEVWTGLRLVLGWCGGAYRPTAPVGPGRCSSSLAASQEHNVAGLHVIWRQPLARLESDAPPLRRQRH